MASNSPIAPAIPSAKKSMATALTSTTSKRATPAALRRASVSRSSLASTYRENSASALPCPASRPDAFVPRECSCGPTWINIALNRASSWRSSPAPGRPLNRCRSMKPTSISLLFVRAKLLMTASNSPCRSPVSSRRSCDRRPRALAAVRPNLCDKILRPCRCSKAIACRLEKRQSDHRRSYRLLE